MTPQPGSPTGVLKRPATDETSSPKAKQLKPEHSGPISATQHGTVILDLVLHCPLLSPRALIPLRGVCKSYRHRIDRQLFQSILIMDTKDGTCIYDAAGRKLPGFQAAFKSTEELDVLSRLQHTKSVTMTQMEKALASELNELKLLDNVHTVRLLSCSEGRHWYQPSPIGNARTMVVFPPLAPQYDSTELRTRVVPNGITKLVQHPAWAVDQFNDVARGPVLFDRLGANVTQEVWVFSNYHLKTSLRPLNLPEDDLAEIEADLGAKLSEVTTSRLKSGKVELTLVDHHRGFANITWAYLLYLGHNQPYSDDGVHRKATVRESLDRHLTECGVADVSKLRLSTWDEYSATLTKEEKAAEALPNVYARHMAKLARERFPEPQCGDVFCCDSCCEGHSSGSSCADSDSD